MEKSDKIYIIFMVMFIATLIGVPAFTNTQFQNVTSQLEVFSVLMIKIALATIHNHAVIIHNQGILIHNEAVLLKAVELHDNNVSHSLRVELRNDTDSDFQNITVPEGLHLESAHIDVKIP